MNFIKKHIKLLVIFVVILSLIIGGLFIFLNRNPYKNVGFKGFYYRVYQNGKWSKWCENGRICGKKGKSITNIEFKTGNDMEDGSVLYNVFKNNEYLGLNSVSQKLLDKTMNIEGLLLTTSGQAYNDYEIYYRTYNTKYGWLNYSKASDVLLTGSGTNGAIGYAIERVQIISVKKDYKIKIDTKSKNEASYGFEVKEVDVPGDEPQETTE